MKTFLAKVLPWMITAVALYFAFRGVAWSDLLVHIHEANLGWIALALSLTCLSYVLRTRRWQLLFPDTSIPFGPGWQVLVLGFFMNNVLPARAGEFVRAHIGAKATGTTRTLVLATVASERLVDGLAISFLFVVFSFSAGDAELSRRLQYVAWLFAAAGLGVIFTLALRGPIFALTERISARFDHKASRYTLDRLHTFINGLSPLCSWRRMPFISAWSLTVWFLELFVFFCVVRAYGAELSISHTVLFLVAVNFSSLIPAAPGGLGVIEAVGTHVLMSVGIPKERALMMVMTQHLIQYLVVGIPGAIIMLRWKDRLREMEAEEAQAVTSESA